MFSNVSMILTNIWLRKHIQNLFKLSWWSFLQKYWTTFSFWLFLQKVLVICLLNLIKIFHHYIKQYSIVHGKINVTFCSTYLLNNKSYNARFFTICFYRIWLISKVMGELQNVIENFANFIKNSLRLPTFVRTLYEEAFSVQIQ